jgi:hypothetical protein
MPIALDSRLVGNNYFLKFETPLPFKPTGAEDGILQSTPLATSIKEPLCMLKIQLNSRDKIELFEYFGCRPIEKFKMMLLYGLHQGYLNNLKSRMQDGLINNLLEYGDL